jgi:hypothetical protein
MLVHALLLLGLLQGAQELRWRSGATVVLGEAGPEDAPDVAERLRELAGKHVLIAFERPPSRHERALLAGAGVELGRSLGRGAYYARIVDTRFDARTFARLGGWIDARALAPEWKRDPVLLAQDPPVWARVASDRDGRPVTAVQVALHARVSPERGQALLESLGGGVFDVLDSTNVLVAHVPHARLAELAAADEVAWVEPVLPRMEGLANDSIRALTGADRAQEPPYGLVGTGVRVLVYDSAGANPEHIDFGGRLVNHEQAVDLHGTHVAGIVAGDGNASNGLYSGMAPGAEIHSYGFTFDSSGLFLFTNPGDLEEDYFFALQEHDVVLANNSIGMNIENRGFPCTLQGDYGVLSSLLDAIVRGSLGQPLPILWAGGNERIGPRCNVPGLPAGYARVPPPATAKNPIAVGAVNSNNDSMTFFSSWGPTDDGRMKPDVCAPGCQTTGDAGVTSVGCCGIADYDRLCGTSMATPAVTGILALALEDHRRRDAGPEPRNATWKALLAHTAVDRGAPGPDYRFGYGSVRALALIEQMRTERHHQEVLNEQGERVRHELFVEAGDAELVLTLAWDDPPGSPSVRDTLVNDLDLVVIDPSGRRHFPWALDPVAPDAPAVRERPNTLDNLEQVRTPHPDPGPWVVEVRPTRLAAGPQWFSLVSSHDLANDPSMQLTFPTPLPTVLEPGVARDVVVRLAQVEDTVVPRSLYMHVRYDGQHVISYPMRALSPAAELFRATLPPPSCGAEPEFGFTVLGAASGLVTSPAGAPAELYQALVAAVATEREDDFEQDTGWSALDDPALLDGGWERGWPEGDGVRGDPYADYDESGHCWLTGNRAGDSDVEGGPTRLLSPQLDLTGPGEVEISYAWWFVNDQRDADELHVELSGDDGASWATVQRVTDGGGGRGWSLHSFVVSEYMAPSDQMRVRFTVADPGQDSVTEAAIDAFRVVRRYCEDVPDCNLNGILDADDIASGRSRDEDENGVPDECE